MSQVIITEIAVNNGWVEIGRISRTDLPGTLLDLTGGKRVLLMFGFFPWGPDDEEVPLVTSAQSEFIIDVGRTARFVQPDHIDILANLTEGPHERIILSGDAIPVRFHVE